MYYKSYPFLCIIGISLLLIMSACDDNIVPVEENGCEWTEDSISVQFYNAMFYLPNAECEYPFECDLGQDEPVVGIYNLIDLANSDVFSHGCDMTWISSIFTKKCESMNPAANESQLTLTIDSLNIRLFSNDLIERSPIVINECGMVTDDYKHQFIIRAPHVINNVTNELGTLTWTYTWLGEENSFLGSTLWSFDCPQEGLYATFTPDYGYYRNIYVHNNFINIR